MADELRDSPFFGERTINFVADLLHFRPSLMALTGFEKKLTTHRDLVLRLDQELDGKLVSIIRETKDYITPATAMRLLLYFQSKDNTQEAHKILVYAQRDELIITEEEVTELIQELNKDPELNVQLWSVLLAKKPEQQQNTVGKPKLNLPSDFR